MPIKLLAFLLEQLNESWRHFLSWEKLKMNMFVLRESGDYFYVHAKYELPVNI